jgi:tRNA (mo5U34)-methyltransferase
MDSAQDIVAEVKYWHHKFEIVPGVWTPGSYDPRFMLDMLHLPDDLTGKRVLDIGPSDGFFSLAMRKRGANVTAVDYRPMDLHGFGAMVRATGLDFDYRQMNLYDIRRSDLGTFDIVLFLGVLYHLPDMLKALAVIREVCNDQLFVETHCDTELPQDVAAARYYRSDTLHGDFTNFWSPNLLCVTDMLHDAAFDVTQTETWGDRCLAIGTASEDPSRRHKLAIGYGLIA